jgi:diguanylate cyclase (GGDEF)-like protein
VANRKAFLDRVTEVSKAGSGKAAVLFIDLDRFKPVNDRHGHPAGDQVLVEVAQRLATAVRPGDLVARVGGDEFAVLCERLGHPGDAESVADRLLDVIGRPLVVPLAPGEPVHVGASIGLTELVAGQSPELVIDRADQALRQAKLRGRGRWVHQPAPT